MNGQILWMEIAERLRRLPDELGPGEHVAVTVSVEGSTWTATVRDEDSGQTYLITFARVTS